MTVTRIIQRHFTYVDNVVRFAALVIFILLVHIDNEFETRHSIKVNPRYTLLRHLLVSDIDELQ